ncbi:MAG: Lrp/AsnC family transcriptional regulator [Chloroflexota bacterium]|nr:Lrp/AsnC family transcriptional regulator [Chloroflexota bacterium]
MTSIDTLDERILAELQANGRLTMKALAERVNLSSPAMIERVRRLEERGVLLGYRAVVSPAALGRPLTALISASVEPGTEQRFLARVKSEAGIEECHRTTGEQAYLVKAHVADPSALEQLIDNLTKAGARCSTSLALSSPVPWQPLTAPEGVATQRTRLTRGRRAAPAETAAPKRRGRPRGVKNRAA